MYVAISVQCLNCGKNSSSKRITLTSDQAMLTEAQEAIFKYLEHKAICFSEPSDPPEFVLRVNVPTA